MGWFGVDDGVLAAGGERNHVLLYPGLGDVRDRDADLWTEAGVNGTERNGGTRRQGQHVLRYLRDRNRLGYSERHRTEGW